MREGRLYGRGSYDMKGAVAAFITATKALQDLGITLAGDLALHVVVDEESGGHAGTQALINRGERADAVIVAEPTTGDIHHSEAGLSWVRVTIFGRSDHAGVRYANIYPQKGGTPIGGGDGINAIEIGMQFIEAVQQLEKDWGRRFVHPLLPAGITTINPGVIHGGVGLGEDGLPIVRVNPAMIPDTCVIDFDFKFMGDFEERKQEFEGLIDGMAASHSWLKENRPTLQWNHSSIYFPPIDTPLDHPLANMIRASRSDLGLETVSTGFPAVTDGAFYAGAGVTPLIYGPNGSGLHGLDEYVEIDSLLESAKVYAGTILRWCGVA
ncbi:MAG: M20/M25/M40 family metallo-hydrolase [Chloroflexota bacterium]